MTDSGNNLVLEIKNQHSGQILNGHIYQNYFIMITPKKGHMGTMYHNERRAGK